MITPRSIPGGSYCEALISGDWAALVKGSHIETSKGPIALPPSSGDGLLFLRSFDSDGLLLAGQKGDIVGPDPAKGHAFLWNGKKWIDKGPSYGAGGPVAFKPTGALVLADPSMGSQGIRTILADGTIITGDATYGSASMNIAEYTPLDNWAIGQSYRDGVVLVKGSARKLLARGDCRFIRANQAGSRIAVGWWQLDQNSSELRWFDESDIASLPDDVAAVPTPQPVPQPQSIPEPPVQTYQPQQKFFDYLTSRWHALNIAGRVRAVWDAAGPEAQERWRKGQNHELRTQLADIASAGLFGILAEWSHGTATPDEPVPRLAYRIYDKPGGTEYHFQGDNGEDISVAEDIIGILLPRNMRAWKDVGGGFGGPDPTLNLGDFEVEPNSDDRYIVPPKSLMEGPAPVPQPVPSPTPTPGPTPPPSDIAQQLAALSARVSKLEQQPPAAFPQRIALKSDHGKYGSVQPDGSIVFDRDSSGPWETVTVEAK